jgi:hypothetical protein
VSRVLIVVKADTRLDNVISNINKYAECFLSLDIDIVGVLVTHMDKVSWSKERLFKAINEQLGITAVVSSSFLTPGDVLQRDILAVCKEEHKIDIESNNFLRMFKINNKMSKILRITTREVGDFKILKKNFDEARNGYKDKELVDLVFEFQAWMAEMIVKAQQRMSDEAKFTFDGDGAANEAGHVANMVNQLRMVLYDIRVMAAGYQTNHGINEQRKCPHCGEVWTKVEGCEGNTVCGNRPTRKYKHDVRDKTFMELELYS